MTSKSPKIRTLNIVVLSVDALDLPVEIHEVDGAHSALTQIKRRYEGDYFINAGRRSRKNLARQVQTDSLGERLAS